MSGSRGISLRSESIDIEPRGKVIITFACGKISSPIDGSLKCSDSDKNFCAGGTLAETINF